MKLSHALVDRIKRLLKEKNITYSNLATRLELSESTIKRWLSTKNLTLKQIEQLCQVSNISFEDLMKSNLLNEQQTHFTKSQEELFYRDEKALAIFYLTAFGLSYNEILKQYSFKERELISKINKLEKENILEFLPKNKIVNKLDLSTMWIPKGKLSTKYFKKIRSEFTNSFFADQHEEQFFLSGRLSPESIKAIHKKLEKLSHEIKEFYLLDSKDKKAKNISLFIGVRPWAFSVVTQYLKKN